MTTAPAFSAQRAYPVRLVLHLPELVRAGVESMLSTHHDRVLLLDDPGDGPAHVDVFDPVDHASQARLARRAGVPLVALVRDAAPASDAWARELGATRVLPLSVGPIEFVHTVEQAHRHGPSATNGSQSPGPPRAGDDLLTPREAEVLSGICRGLSNQEIGAELYLSINSIKTYVRSAYRKMEVTSRSQAVLWGLERGY